MRLRSAGSSFLLVREESRLDAFEGNQAGVEAAHLPNREAESIQIPIKLLSQRVSLSSPIPISPTLLY